MTYEEWEEAHRPIRNTTNPDRGFDSHLFETYGEDLEEVRRHTAMNPECIWTLVESDGYIAIISGFHLVNRIGYFITEVPCPANTAIEILLDDPYDED